MPECLLGTQFTNLLDHTTYSSNLPQLNNADLTPTLPDFLDPQPGLLYQRLQLLRCPLDPVDNPHQGQISRMAKPSVPAVVLRQGLWRGAELGTAKCSVHDLVADEDA